MSTNPIARTTSEDGTKTRVLSHSACLAIWRSCALSFARLARHATAVIAAPPPSQTTAAKTWIDLNTSVQFVFERKRTATARAAIGPRMPSHSSAVLVPDWAGASVSTVVGCVTANSLRAEGVASKRRRPHRHVAVARDRPEAVPPQRTLGAARAVRVAEQAAVNGDVPDVVT